MKALILGTILALAIAPFSSVVYASPITGQLNIGNPTGQVKVAQNTEENSSDSAKKLVICGSHGAARIETQVPSGCQASTTNSPPSSPGKTNKSGNPQ